MKRARARYRLERWPSSMTVLHPIMACRTRCCPVGHAQIFRNAKSSATQLHELLKPVHRNHASSLRLWGHNRAFFLKATRTCPVSLKEVEEVRIPTATTKKRWPATKSSSTRRSSLNRNRLRRTSIKSASAISSYQLATKTRSNSGLPTRKTWWQKQLLSPLQILIHSHAKTTADWDLETTDRTQKLKIPNQWKN